jgi:gliding motility-associated-like protein
VPLALDALILTAEAFLQKLFSRSYDVTYMIPGECGDTYSIQVIVDASDNASIFDETSFCLGWGNVQFDAEQSGGYWTAECGDCVDPVTGVFNTLESGIGNFDITYNFDGVCGASEAMVFQVVPNEDSSIEPIFGYCVDANSQLLVAANPGGAWSADCNNCISNSGIFEPGIAGPGEFEITYVLPGPCGTTSTEILEVFPLPVVNFNPGVNEGCSPLAVGFATAEPVIGNCQWSFGDGQFGIDCNSTSHIFQNPGCYDISLTVTSTQGCVNSMFQSDAVCVFPNPISAFIYTPVQPDTDNPIIELQELASGEIAYEWNFAGVETSTDPYASYNLLNTGELSSHICLKVIDANGCTNTFCRNIEMIEKLRVYVPSAFTPDGDGINEVFVPVVLGADFYEFTIFDRWGAILFESTIVGEPWLGEVNGGEYFAQPGLYLWHLKVLGQDLEGREYSGHVMLIR